MPELNFVFNVVHDVFILKGAEWRDTVIYGVFTSQWSVISKKKILSMHLKILFPSFNPHLFFFLSIVTPIILLVPQG